MRLLTVQTEHARWSLNIDAKKMREAFRRGYGTPGLCVLCGKVTGSRGVFLPKGSGELGAPEGKYRVVIYPLCNDHQKTMKTFEDVESVLESLL